MLAKLLPLFFLLVGTGSGITAGIFFSQPSVSPTESGGTAESASHATKIDTHGNMTDSSASEFVKMSNQFVIPVVGNDMIEALVVVSLSLETRLGISEEIYAREPKLRDAFLRVLFDHANMGGFHGAYTRAETMDLLRTALREVARKEIGPDIVDVLILDIIRQDA